MSERRIRRPYLIGFSNEHPGAAARLFKDFAKENKAFEIKQLHLKVY